MEVSMGIFVKHLILTVIKLKENIFMCIKQHQKDAFGNERTYGGYAHAEFPCDKRRCGKLSKDVISEAAGCNHGEVFS